jgi:hypothetical protein
MNNESRVWQIDLGELTGADVADLLAADAGDLDAADRLLRKVVRPDMAAVPLAEWNAARKEMIRAVTDRIFRSEQEPG